MSPDEPRFAWQSPARRDAEFDVMHLEDDATSAAGLFAQTSLAGIAVDVVDDVASARSLLRERRYRVLVVDLEVLDESQRRRDAGADFIKELLGGKLGQLNVSTPIIVHTAYLGAFEESGLSSTAQVHLIRKPASAYDLTAEIVRPAGNDVVLVEVVPMSKSAPSTEGFLVRIPGWANQEFEVPMATFDVEQMMEIVVAEEELYFSGLVNLDAEAPSNLGLRIIEAIPGGEGKGSIWDD